MSLKVTLPSQKTISVRNKSLTTTNLVIEKVIDVPSKKSVVVVLKDLGRVKLAALSGDNYNNPEWTDSSVQAAVLAQLGG